MINSSSRGSSRCYAGIGVGGSRYGSDISSISSLNSEISRNGKPIQFGKRGRDKIPDSKVHGANMWLTWVLSAPDEPHAGPVNLAIRDKAKPKPTRTVGLGIGLT